MVSDGRGVSALRPAERIDLLGLPLEVAPRLLGAHLTTVLPDGIVTVRLTEVEAYHGLGTGEVADPASHARMGRTARNATMWGEPGHLYVYLSHGIHSCVNVVCGPEGVAGGILLRAGEVIEGVDVAARRRPTARAQRDLARGPGRLGDAVGLRHPLHDGIDAVAGIDATGGIAAVAGPAVRAGATARLELATTPIEPIATGPRVGVAGVAGTDEFPWRFWIPGDPTVSPFRPGRGAGVKATRGPMLD